MGRGLALASRYVLLLLLLLLLVLPSTLYSTFTVCYLS